MRDSVFVPGRFLIPACATLAAVALGCPFPPEATNTPPSSSVTGGASLVDRVSSALTTSSMRALKGNYGMGCTDRAGTWTVGLNGYVFLGDEHQLSVVTGDSACVLSVAEVKAGPLASPVVYQPAVPFSMGAAFAGVGVPFTINGAGATQFFANFSIQPNLAFTSDFVIQMVYSDDVSQTDLNADTSYVASIATSGASSVPAPNAALTLAGLDIRVDASNVVKTATGAATLTQGTVVGESYVVDLDTLGVVPSFGLVDAAFTNPANTQVLISGASQGLGAAVFSLVDLDVTTPQHRNVIVANEENGVRSYQVFRVNVRRPVAGAVDGIAPTVISTLPVDGATVSASLGGVSVTFSEAMAPASLTAATFTLFNGATQVVGVVGSSGSTATLGVAGGLTVGSTYTATVTTGALDLAGNALAMDHVWTFSTGAAGVGPVAPNLGTAANFAVLGVDGIAIGTAGSVSGDVGISPGDAAALTGFDLVLDASGTFATSTLVVGRVYAHDHSAPTPTLVATAVTDMQAAYADGLARTSPDGLNLGAGELGGLTLTPGFYAWPAAATVTTDMTLNGGPDDVWLLRVDAALTLAASASVLLTGGAQPRNVYWVVGGALTLGADAVFEGNALGASAATTGAGTVVHGRLLAGTRVDIGAASPITRPVP